MSNITFTPKELRNYLLIKSGYAFVMGVSTGLVIGKWL